MLQQPQGRGTLEPVTEWGIFGSAVAPGNPMLLPPITHERWNRGLDEPEASALGPNRRKSLAGGEGLCEGPLTTDQLDRDRYLRRIAV